MQEILMVGGAKKSDFILEVDVTRQAVGDTTLVDWSGNQTFTLAGSGPVVADVAGIGKVMQFLSAQGRGYFQTQKPIDLSKDQMSINVVFQCLNNSLTQMVWCTGDYSTRIISGLAHYAMVGVGGHQLFPTDSAGNFTRCSINGPQSQVFDLTIQTLPATKQLRVKNNVSGEVQLFSAPSWFGAGDRLAVGGSYVGGLTYAPFQGYIKKLTIAKMV